MVLFLSLVALFGTYILLKNQNTYEKHRALINLIFEYNMRCIAEGKPQQVTFDDMESYDHTLFRLWDWSEKRIVPKEKYDILLRFTMEGEV